MSRHWKLIFALLAIAVACTFFVTGYLRAQADFHDGMLKQLSAYLNAESVSTLKREAAFVRELKSNLEQRMPPEFHAKSDVETRLYLQVKERIEGRQKVRVYVLSRNTSWTSRAFINGPYSYILEWWKASPSESQIKNSIGSSRIQHFGGDVVLWPRQAQMIYTDFVFPYPMTTDFTVSTSFTENRLDERAEKFVKDSALLHGADIDSARVIPQ